MKSFMGNKSVLTLSLLLGLQFGSIGFADEGTPLDLSNELDSEVNSFQVQFKPIKTLSHRPNQKTQAMRPKQIPRPQPKPNIS